MKRLFLLALCLVLSIPAHADQYVLRRFIPGQDGLSADVGIVLTYNPGATVTREGEASTPLAERSKIYQGDTIETDGSGSLVIGFIDGTRLSIDPDSKITIQFHNSGTHGVWSILKGLYAFVSGAIAKSGDDAMVINTPVGTIGVRGTAGIIDLYRTLPGGMRVILLPDPNGDVGRITVTNGTGSRTIDNAYDTIVVSSEDAAPGDGGPISPEEINAEYGEVKYNLEQQIGDDTDLTPDPDIDDTQTGDITLPDTTDQELGVEVAMQRPFGPLNLTPRAVAPISVLATQPAGDPVVTAFYCLGSTITTCDGTWTSSPGYARTGQYLWLKATSPTLLEGGITVVTAKIGLRNLVWRIRTRDFIPDAFTFPASTVTTMQFIETSAPLSGFTGSLTASVSDLSEVGGMTRFNVLRAGSTTWESINYGYSSTVGQGDTIQIVAQGKSVEDTSRPITLTLTTPAPHNQVAYSTTWSLKTVSSLTADTLSATALLPATGATGVAPHTSLIMTFNRPATAGTTGSIHIKKGTEEIHTIDIAGAQVTTSENTATIALPDPLPGNATYSVAMDDGVFKATDNSAIIFPAASATPANPLPTWTFSTYNALPSFCANGNLTLPATNWSSSPGILLETLAGLGGPVTMRQEEVATHLALAPSVLRNGTAVDVSNNMLVMNGDSIKLLPTNPPPFSETTTNNSIKIGDCSIVWPVKRLLTPQFSPNLPDATAMNLPASPELSLDFVIPPEFDLAPVANASLRIEKISDTSVYVPLVYLQQEEGGTDWEQVRFPGKLIPKWPLEPDTEYRIIIPAGAFTATFNAGEIIVDSAPVSGDAWKIKTGTFQTGWLAIPASAPVTEAFSIMKYEAKYGSNNTPVSTARGVPWTNLSLEAAQAACNSLGAGYHLVKESEWLAIAHLIKSDPGHNKLDNTFKYGKKYDASDPGDAWSDNLPDMTGSSTSNSRILLLSEGPPIWDFAGGVKEWSQCDAPAARGCNLDGTSFSLILYLSTAWGDYIFLGQELSGNGYFYYSDGETPIPPDSPLNPGITAGIDGLGKVVYGYNPLSPIPVGFLRGGDGSDATHSGAFMLETAYPNAGQTNIGFRCAGPASAGGTLIGQ